jgi:hypothetical protein
MGDGKINTSVTLQVRNQTTIYFKNPQSITTVIGVTQYIPKPTNENIQAVSLMNDDHTYRLIYNQSDYTSYKFVSKRVGSKECIWVTAFIESNSEASKLAFQIIFSKRESKMIVLLSLINYAIINCVEDIVFLFSVLRLKPFVVVHRSKQFSCGLRIDVRY